MLFEAKTYVLTSTIYQAIGQLLYHSAVQSPAPRRIMVLPEGLGGDTARVVKSLNIEVLVYNLTERNCSFHGINALIASLGAR